MLTDWHLFLPDGSLTLLIYIPFRIFFFTVFTTPLEPYILLIRLRLQGGFSYELIIAGVELTVHRFLFSPAYHSGTYSFLWWLDTSPIAFSGHPRQRVIIPSYDRTAIYTAGLALYVKILLKFDIPTNIAFFDHRQIILNSYYIDAGMGHRFYDSMWNRSGIYSISM